MSSFYSDLAFELGLRAQTDEWYQQLLKDCEQAEAAYLLITSVLTEAQREQLEKYISLCEEMQYRMTVLAYELGEQHGKCETKEISFRN